MTTPTLKETPTVMATPSSILTKSSFHSSQETKENGEFMDDTTVSQSTKDSIQETTKIAEEFKEVRFFMFCYFF